MAVRCLLVLLMVGSIAVVEGVEPCAEDSEPADADPVCMLHKDVSVIMKSDHQKLQAASPISHNHQDKGHQQQQAAKSSAQEPLGFSVLVAQQVSQAVESDAQVALAGYQLLQESSYLGIPVSASIAIAISVIAVIIFTIVFSLREGSCKALQDTLAQLWGCSAGEELAASDDKGATSTSPWVYDFFLLLSNIVAAVGIIGVNKQVLTVFPYTMALTGMHALVGGILMSFRNLSVFPTKTMPTWANCWMTFLFMGCIYVQNQSLRINSVTLYQITKLMTVPGQCLWQYVFHKKVYSAYVYSAVAVLTVGVGLGTLAEIDMKATMFGLIVAALAVTFVLMEQAEIGRIKNKFEIESLDFLLSFFGHRLILVGIVLLTTEREALKAFRYMQPSTIGLMILSCFFAVVINLSCVSIIGKFGPLTMGVVGHLKTIFIFFLGFAMRPPAMDFIFLKQGLGMSIALGGAIKYWQYTSFPVADGPKKGAEEIAEDSSTKDSIAKDGQKA